MPIRENVCLAPALPHLASLRKLFCVMHGSGTTMIGRWVPCEVYSSLVLLSSLLSASRVLREWNIKGEKTGGRAKEINQLLSTIHLQKVHLRNGHTKPYQESFIIKIWKINLNPKPDHIVYIPLYI